MRPEIGLGDLVAVLNAMALLDGGSLHEARQFARALGLEARNPAGGRSSAPPQAAVVADPPSVPIAPAAASPSPLSTDVAGQAVSLALQIGERPSGSMPALASPMPPPPDTDDAEPCPPFDPLFSPASSRSLIATALATWRRDGVIDTPWLVAHIAARRPVVRVPRLPRLALAHGVQVLVDHGPGMDPFARDAAVLIEQMRAIAGGHRVEVLRFADDPGIAGHGPRRTWRPYRPPETGVRVIALTDLGIAAPRLRLPASDLAWHAFATRIDRAGGSLLCIVPYPRARWPSDLIDVLTILTWDRATTVAQVRRALRSVR